MAKGYSLDMRFEIVSKIDIVIAEDPLDCDLTWVTGICNFEFNTQVVREV